MTTKEFCETLVARFPVLKEVLIEHVSYFDELLPNVFLADVARYLLGDGIGRIQIVEYLNHSLARGNRDIENLIAISFVEILENRDELEFVIRGLNVPEIVAEWVQQKSQTEFSKLSKYGD